MHLVTAEGALEPFAAKTPDLRWSLNAVNRLTAGRHIGSVGDPVLSHLRQSLVQCPTLCVLVLCMFAFYKNIQLEEVVSLECTVVYMREFPMMDSHPVLGVPGFMPWLNQINFHLRR